MLIITIFYIKLLSYQFDANVCLNIQALRKEPLTVYGDGKQTRSFQYVSDLVHFSFLHSCNGSSINYGSVTITCHSCGAHRKSYKFMVNIRSNTEKFVLCMHIYDHRWRA